MIFLPYGTGQLEFPDRWDGQARVIEPGPFPDGTVGADEVAWALQNPTGSPRLAEIARPGQKVVLVIPDLTRRAAVSTYLPPLLEELSGAGIGDDDITIVVALGIHRPLVNSELEALTGEEVCRRFKVVNHDCDAPEANVYLGQTTTGLPVEINRSVAEADLVVLTGSITYHYFAGYGGGRKSLLPGVASRKSCEANHRMVVDFRRGKLSGAIGGMIGPGILDNNPVHSAMIEACAMVPPIFVLNTVTDPHGNITAASAGELVQAHVEACRHHDFYYQQELEECSRLVIASSGGSPKDINFVQAHKGLYSAHMAVAQDGVVILTASCQEGTGHIDFMSWFERCSTESRWLEELEKNYQINGQTAFSTWLRVRSVPTVLISELPDEMVGKMGMIPASNPEEALERATGILGELPVPLVLPDAGDTLTVVRSAECKV
jgi:nickel-dependent lactate racemase